MILGNKCDIEEQRRIPKERGESITNENGIKFLKTSAKTNVNVEKAVLQISESILGKLPGTSQPSTNITPTKHEKAANNTAAKCC